MSAPYAFFEHTADIGIQAESATLAGLFEQLARGLVELIAEKSALKTDIKRTLVLEASDAEALLLVWLQELLFLFSTTRFLPVTYTLAVTPTQLKAELQGDVFDPHRHTQGREVKAITRHALSVQQRGDRWQGRVIVDI